jgi:hypothetical protein
MKTFKAKLFTAGQFKMAGTLEGDIDFVVPGDRTYLLSVEQARTLIAILGLGEVATSQAESLVGALRDVIKDIQLHCRFDNDALLESRA